MRKKLLYSRKFGFQKDYSTDHAIVHTVPLENDNFILGVFIDLSKIFDIVDDSVLLQKLEMYNVNTKSLDWLASYLNGRKQYIEITECAETVKKDILCGVL